MRLCWLAIMLMLGVASLGLSQEDGASQDAHVRVLIGSVVNKRPEIAQEFLQSLQSLRKENCRCDYYFVVEQSSELVQQHIAILERSDPSYKSSCVLIDPSKERPLGCSYAWLVGSYKDRMIEHARKNNYDYLFLIDADLVLNPETLKHLVSLKKDIVSNLFWSDSKNGPVPQVWLSDNMNRFDMGLEQSISDEEREKRTAQFYAMLKIPGTYEVGGLGACTLIGQNALKKPIHYQRIRNISWTSEDVHFSLRAVALGIPLFVDTHYPAYHIVRDSGECSLAGVIEFKKNVGIST